MCTVASRWRILIGPGISLEGMSCAICCAALQSTFLIFFYISCSYFLRLVWWRPDADQLFTTSHYTERLSPLPLSLTSPHNRAGPPPEPAGGAPGARRPGFFSGGGHTLGSDEVESTFIPDPTAPAEGSSESLSLPFFSHLECLSRPYLNFSQHRPCVS